MTYPANRPKHHRKKASTGFTLIEILVAIFIFSIIMTTIFGSYRSVFSNVDRIDEVNRSYEMAKNSLSRMLQDLASLYVSLPPAYRQPGTNDSPDPYRIQTDTVTVAGSDFSQLRFTSLAHLPFENTSAEGITEITYYVQPDENENPVLRRSDKLYPFGSFSPSSNDPILCRDLKSLSFVFFDEEGNEFERWDSESKDDGYATPQAIVIRLEIGAGLHSLVVESAVKLPVFRNKSGK